MKTIALLPLVLILSAPVARAQEFTFSINWRGPSVAVQSSTPPGFLLNEADILTFGPGSPGFGTLQAPGYALFGAQLGLNQYSNCLNHAQNDPCGIEVDALSQGNDAMLSSGTFAGPGPGTLPLDEVWLSVDSRAAGRTQTVFGATSATEAGAVGDVSADVFMAYGIGIGPVPPGAAPGTNVGVFDGNGLRSSSTFVYPGIGLIEPNFPGSIPATGDNLDALDIGAMPGFPSSGVYFSLDASFPDPAMTAIVNSGSAAAQGVSAADVLHTVSAGTIPLVYAPAFLLGLDRVGGPNSDDLDALVLADNGDGIFQPSKLPYDWEDGTKDMLLFSVRRGSAVIGRPDSIFGIPIEEGDILTTPKPIGMGGLSLFPGIMYAAEALGLRTSRTHGVMFGDDLDALDFEAATCFDCNNNGIEDAVDISTGASSDENRDGVPDECEKALEFCFCPSSVAPCLNDADLAGCGNSATAGARLYTTGSTSVGSDDLVIVTDGLPLNKPGLYYMGAAGIVMPLGDGIRCVGSGGVGVFRYTVQNSGGAGVFSAGPGIAGASCSLFNMSGCISAGDTWFLQAWYRDPTGPCGGQFNFSNAVRVQFEL